MEHPFKLTPEELTFFQSVSDTETGRFLVSYVKHIQDYVCDSRTWGKEDTKETAQKVAALLQQMFVDKMRPKYSAPEHKNQFE